MLSFKTIQTALPLTMKIQLSNLVSAVKDASKLDPLLDSTTLRATPEIQAVIAILNNPEVASLLKTHTSLVAEIMLHAEVHMQHPVVGLLASTGGHIDNEGQIKIPFAESIRLRFAHVCLHSPTTDTQISGSREHEIYSIRPLEERTKEKGLASSSSQQPSTQCPEVTKHLTAEELFNFFKTYKTLPKTQSSDEDYLEMILWTIQNRRINEIVAIKNSTFESVQFANKDKLLSLIAQTKKEDGQQYIRNFIEKSLAGNESAFLEFIKRILQDARPYNIGCLEVCLEDDRSFSILRDNLGELLNIATSSGNEAALHLLNEKKYSILITQTQVMTMAYNASIQSLMSQTISTSASSSQREEVPTQSILSSEMAAIVDAYTSKLHQTVVRGLKPEVLSVFNNLDPETARAFGDISIHTAANVLKFNKMPVDTQISKLRQMQELVQQQIAKQRIVAKS